MRPTGTKRAIMLCAASAIGLSAAMITAPAFAQDEARRSTSVSEVVVTAGKREQDLQDVPASVTAFTAEVRDETGIISAQQQMNFTPGVFYNPGFDRVTVRGIGRVTNALGTDPGVAVYNDGFYVGSIAGIGGSTLLTERVEVLRGPQGTLYGRNSIGGAVNTISRRPTDAFNGEVRTSINNLGGTLLEGRISGGLTDTLSGALAIGGFNQEEGAYKNVSNDKDEGGPQESWYIDGQLAWQPNDQLEFWARYNTSDTLTYPRNSTGITRYGVPSRGVGSPYVFYGLGADDNPGVNDHRKFRADRRSEQRVHNYHLLLGEATFHADSFDVKYLGGYRTYDSYLLLDGNATDNIDFDFPLDCTTLASALSGGVDPRSAGLEDCDLTQPGIQRVYQRIHNDITQNTFGAVTNYSHEINLTSTWDGPLQYILGLYYYYADEDQIVDISSHNEPGNNVMTDHLLLTYLGLPAGAPTAPPNPSPDESLIYRVENNLKTTSTAIFGQVDYAFSEQWKATVGLRYSKDEKEGYENFDLRLWLVTGFPIGWFGVNPTVLPYNYVFPSCPSVTAPGVPPIRRIDPRYSCPVERDLSGEWDEMTGTAGLEWTPNAERLVYAKYSRGYKSGGFNLGSMGAEPFVDSETVDAFELGWKEVLSDRLQFNSAAFFYKYNDQQAIVSEVRDGVAFSVLVNLPKVENYGFELESIWNPIDPLRFFVNYSYLHTEITDGGAPVIDTADPLGLQPGAKPIGPLPGVITENSVRGQTLTGNVLAQSPEHKVAVNGTYTFMLENLGDLIVSATYNWKSDSYSTLFNNPLHLIEGGGSADLRATWRVADTGLTVIGTVTNVFDEEVMSGFFTDTPNRLSFQSLFLEPPRAYSLELRYVF